MHEDATESIQMFQNGFTVMVVQLGKLTKTRLGIIYYVKYASIK